MRPTHRREIASVIDRLLEKYFIAIDTGADIATRRPTIYRVLGIDPKLQLLDPSGRPVNVLDDPEAIDELF